MTTNCSVGCFLWYPVFAFYYVLYQLLKWIRPVTSFSLECGKHFYGLVPSKEEWELEKVKEGETMVIEGSTGEGSSIYIEVVTHRSFHSATVYLIDEGRTLFGQFKGARGDDEQAIQCGPLGLEMRLPFRQWRVTFKGYLTDDTKEDHFVSLGGWWKPTSNARFHYSRAPLSVFMPFIMENPIAVKKNMTKICSLIHAKEISQFGQLFVEINCDGQTRQLRTRGLRQKFSNHLHSSAEEFHVYMDDGTRLVHRRVTSSDHSVTVSHGSLTRCDHRVRSIKLNNPSALYKDNGELIHFRPNAMLPYELRKDSELSENTYVSTNKKIVTLKRISVVHGLNRGVAILKTTRESYEDVVHPHFERFDDYSASPDEISRRVLPFTHRACQDKLFTGGKGANLARLRSIEHRFTVPHGVVVTTTGFEDHLHQFTEIRKLIEKLSTAGLSLEEYVAIGEKIQAAFSTSEVTPTLIEELQENGILNVNGRLGVKYAVRSSAVGEDGSDLSSAGQLESVLNVEFNDIAAKIIECWCSNFRREVITYRRTHGQILNPSMAVVIQEMVNDGCAGVMFTCDPVRNDDGRMVINAIKGMGEDIVSGAVTPDEISIVKKGYKVTKPEICCLDDSSLKHLSDVGLFLEKVFGRAQDVEFVVKHGRVHLVQSRDVTGRDRESTFELMTEFDDPTLSEREVYTTANVGEVLPVAMVPLERCMFDNYDKTMGNMCLKEVGNYQPRHFSLGFLMHGQRILFSCGELFLRQYEIIEKDRLAEISIAGTLMFTDEMFKQAAQRFEKLPKYAPLMRMYSMLKSMFFDSYTLLASITGQKEQIEKLTPKGEVSMDRLFEIQDLQNRLMADVLESHSLTSGFSSFTYIIVGMLIRGSEAGGMEPEMLSDFANVFSNCTSNVISADVPAALKKLSESIKEDGLEEEFGSAEGLAAIELLRTKGKQSKSQLEAFIKTHGHRGPKELYLRSDGWGDKPEVLVTTIKTMLLSKEDETVKEAARSTDEIIDSLKCKPQGLRRKLMKYMVGQTHRGVAGREFAKSCLVKAVYELRQTTKMIGQKLFNEGFIADEDLFFFMTHKELRSLYKTRSAKIISRAMRRKQIFSQLEERQYAHMYYGNPEPINLSTLNDFTSTVSLPGTVVCEGTVIAKARVAANLEEAKDTQPGEILITRCTDICWSPYFPIIKGIVTEIGGLLSHGAVVAREYGLPSLIAVEHATHVFKTGNLVELNTYKGTISKIETKEE